MCIRDSSKIAGQVIATPGCESNVKEIFDKTWELKQDPSMMIFNQFEEMGNPLWHYNVTGYALADLFEAVKKPGQKLARSAAPRCPYPHPRGRADERF